jgi:geranylgeranyl reductase family protein
MLHSTTFDVVVAGAGPAGSIAARDLARCGARVALVDGSHPREKPCGGGVTGRALELAEATDGRAVGQVITGQIIDAVTFEAGGHSARVRLPRSDYLKVFPRAALDGALLRQAIDAGATHIPSRVTSLSRTAGHWQITAGQSISTPWLLGADGPAGIVRKQVFRPFERRQLSIAAGSYVDGVDTSEIVIGFIDEPCGYLWSFPRPGHLAVGTCAQANETTSAEMHAVTDAWLDSYPVAAGRTRTRYSWPIPSLDARDLDAERLAGDGWMLLGDAAGLVDPITREGIFFALRSGLLAATALGTPSPERIYSDAVRDQLHDELRRAARLKAGFYRPRFTRLLIDALNQSPAIQNVMLDLVAGRQSYRGLKRRLLGTWEVGLMWQFATKSGDSAS